MDIKEFAARSAMESWKAEIERGIDNVKRTESDKWWRRRFYIETNRLRKAMGRGKSNKGWQSWRRKQKRRLIPHHIENKSGGDGTWRNRYVKR